MSIYADKVNQSSSQLKPSKKPEAETNNDLVFEQSKNGRQTNNLARLQEKADSSPKVGQSLQLQASADAYSQTGAILHKKENKTGLPDNLKSGIEKLSGISMDDVKVHQNSDKPAQLNAHAYAQGTDIHLSAGQEKHLPHEAWHVVQQKQGRVQPTKQLRSKLKINDDAGLEKEADLMGNKALQMKNISVSKEAAFVSSSSLTTQLYANDEVLQRDVGDDDLEYEAETEIDLDNLENDSVDNENENVMDESEGVNSSELEKIPAESKFAQAKRAFVHLKNAGTSGSQFLALATDAGEGIESGGVDLAQNSAVRQVGFLDSFAKWLRPFAGMPLISMALNLKGMWDLYFSAKRKKQSRDAFSKLAENEESDAQEIGVYAYKKVARGFIDACIGFGAEFIDFIGSLSAFIGAFVVGVGAIAGGIIKSVAAGIKALRAVGRSIKGIWKLFTGKKGKNREKNSAGLISAAGEGDEGAAEAILGLHPKNLKLNGEDAKGVDSNYPSTSNEVTQFINILSNKNTSQLEKLKTEVMNKMRSTSAN